MFGIGEKDRDGRQKRIEHRGRYLRVSRTGGIAVRQQLRAGGLNLTANSKHGIRVSTKIAKGTNVALQNGKLRLRGRYGKGPTKLNLSKSGFSVSTKNAIGTFNLMKPNRSSVKLGGIQIRGKNAATIQAVYAVLALAAFVIQAAVVCVVFLAQVAWLLLKLMIIALFWLTPVLVNGSLQFVEWAAESIRDIKRRKLRAKANLLHRDMAQSLDDLTSTDLEEILRHVINDGGRGKALDASLEQALDAVEEPKATDRLRILLLALTLGYRSKAQESALSELYLTIDAHCVENGGRTRLQEILLADYASINELKLQAA